MTTVSGSPPSRRARQVVELLVAVLLSPGSAAGEVVDQSVAIPASAQVTQLVQSSALVPVENRNPVGGGAADLDGNGTLDVLVMHRLPEELPLLLLNDGQGHLTDAPTGHLPVLEAGETFTAALVDLDNDGARDVYVGRRSHDAVWLNDGQGVFHDATATWLPEGWGGTTALASGDLTGDGRPDLIVVQSGAVRVLENVFGNALREATSELLPQPLEGVHCVLLFDADGDGDLDLMTAGAETLQCFLNERPRMRALAPRHNPQRQPVTGLATGDLDGDGLPEVVMSRRGQPLVWRNRGNTQFVSQPGLIRAPGFANGIVLADVNGDHRPDVILPMTGPNALIVNPGTKGQWRLQPGWLPSDNEASRLAFVGDFNGDGLPDLYVANDGQDCLYLQVSKP